MTHNFKNTPNQARELKDGSIIWDSRASASVAVVSVHHKDQVYIALNKRGPKTPDFQGHWCLPCGYIDWDESAYDAARREIWEELGLDVSGLGIDSSDQPWYVNSDPVNSNRQNISQYFSFNKRGNLSELPQLSSENCEPGEVDDVRWWEVKEALKQELAFNHNSVINRWIDRYYIERIEGPP